MTTRSRVPLPMRTAAPPRSPSCASPTGSAARSTTCAPSGPRSPCRSSPRSSSWTRGSWTCCVGAGADLVLLLAALHPPAELARLVAQARDLGLEPLVEAHDAKELDAALATDARLIGINNRDLRTLDVDPERPSGCATRSPATAWPSPSPASATPPRSRAGVPPASMPRWSAEALMRAPPTRPPPPGAFVVGAGRQPVRPGRHAARAPRVKICGITGRRRHPRGDRRAGADAIGLNFAPGTPRAHGEGGRRSSRLAPGRAVRRGRSPSASSSGQDLPPTRRARARRRRRPR